MAKAASPGYVSNPFGLLRPIWAAFRHCALNLFYLLLLFIGLALILAVFVALTFVSSQLHWLAILMALGIAGVVGVGLCFYLPWMFTVVILSAAQGKSRRLFDCWPPSFGRAAALLGTNILAGLAILGGFVLLLVPGFIFGTWLSFVSYVVVEEGLTGIAALRRSRELVRGRFWEVAGANLLPSVFSIVNVVPFIGSILSLVVAVVMTPLSAVRYVTLKQLKTEENWQTVPVSGWNYATVIVGVTIAVGVNVLAYVADINAHKTPSTVENTFQSY